MILDPQKRLAYELQFGKRVALSRREGLGPECLAPCGQDRFAGPLIHEHLLADKLFHCFARLGVSAFRAISRAKSRARRMGLPGSAQRPYRGTVDAYVRALVRAHLGPD